MADPTIWWILAGVAVGVELLTGTFYLLMLALGLGAAAIAAHAGATSVAQMLVAAAVGGGAVTGWRALRKHRTPSRPAGSNRDVNLDVGETVHVDFWSPDGTGTVKYRGAQWAVESAAGQAPSTGIHEVVEVIGNRLVLKKK